MANTNDTYEKVNWGWLFDYNGYKFAPITFVNQLYNNDGTTFMEKYQDDLHAINTKLSSESFVQNARYLVNSSGSKLTVGNASQPVYFSDGIPKVCSNLSASNMTLTNATISNNLTVKNITISSGGTITGNLTGNASTATKATTLANPRTITIGNTSKSFDGSANMSWTHANIGATVSLNVNTSNNTLKATVNGVESSAVTLPTGLTSQAQEFIGAKTFKDPITIHSADTSKLMLKYSFDYGTYPTPTTNSDGTTETGYKTQQISFVANTSYSSSGFMPYATVVDQLDSTQTHTFGLRAYRPIANRSSSAYAMIYLQIEDNGYCIAGVKNGSYLTGASTDGVNSSGVGQSNTIVFQGACWNDYAEYRNQVEDIEPGYCVASTNDGKVYKTTEKCQPCDGIVSDTYGFIIGKTEQCKTPLAVSGRVLAYFNGNREDYNAGDTVCAGPDGKICKMTREEIKEYPDRIIGIVSEIPEYEEWNSRKVNNRIWIKVK